MESALSTSLKLETKFTVCVYSGSPRSSRGCFVSIAKKSKILTCNEIFAYIAQDTSIYEEIWKLNQNLRFTNENTRTVHSFHEFFTFPAVPSSTHSEIDRDSKKTNFTCCNPFNFRFNFYRIKYLTNKYSQI